MGKKRTKKPKAAIAEKSQKKKEIFLVKPTTIRLIEDKRTKLINRRMTKRKIEKRKLQEFKLQRNL